MENSIIEARDLRKSFDKNQALRGIDLNVKEGEIFGLVGPDGAGKTTLIRILAGILSYDSGEARVMGKDLRDRIEGIRQEIGYVSQRFRLYGDLTVGENINFFESLFPGGSDSARRKEKLLDFIGLSRFTERLASNLSGGMKQKLALLCALIHNPRLLLMDEPTTGVDPVSRREFWEIVFKLQEQGLTVMASTPYMDEAEQFDRVALIRRGVFLQVGTADEIRKSVPGEVAEIQCSQPALVRKILKTSFPGKEVELFGDKVHLFVDKADDKALNEIRKILDSKGVIIQEVSPSPYSIEDVFLAVSDENNN